MNKKVQISVLGDTSYDLLMVAADSLARLKRLLGEDVSLFATDNEFHQVFKISSEDRPSSQRDQVLSIITRLQQSGDVYLKDTPCRVCEECHQPGEAKECPSCGGVTIETERACYYLRLSDNTQKISEMLRPDLFFPPSQRNDLLNSLINRPPDDVLVAVAFSREEKEIMPLPWFQFLADNLAWCGYSTDEAAFPKLWAETYIFISRDLLEYISPWCGMLSALNLPAPRAIVSHHSIQILDGKGQEVRPLLLAKNYGYQGLRYFMMGTRVGPGENSYTEEQVIKVINHDLANELGNLVSRVISLVTRFSEGIIPAPDLLTRRTSDLDLRETALDLPVKIKAHLENQELSRVVRLIKNLVGETNRFIESSAPWQLAGSPDKQGRLNTVLYNLCETLRFLAVSLKPILPEAGNSILQQLGVDGSSEITTWSSVQQWGLIPFGFRINEQPALFPRILPGFGGIGPEPDLIMREDLARIKMVAARVVSAEPVPEYEGLFQLFLYDGRQRIRVLAPVAHSYTPLFLSGKKVILIANLRPVEANDLYSEGEVLLAESESGRPVLVFVGDDIPEGSKILCLS